MKQGLMLASISPHYRYTESFDFFEENLFGIFGSY